MLPSLAAQQRQDFLPRLLQDGVASRPAEQVAKSVAELVRRLGAGERESPAVVFALEAVLHGGGIRLVLVGDLAVSAAQGVVDRADDRLFAVRVPHLVVSDHVVESLSFKRKLVTEWFVGSRVLLRQ